MLPNGFTDESGVAIIGDSTGSTTDPYLIAATGLIYEFELYTAYNDIPNDSMITVGWPDNWVLDCSLPYTVTGIEGYTFSSGACVTAKNRLELYGYVAGTQWDYIANPGRIIFQIAGITNPDTDVIKYFTVASWHQHLGSFYEIDSSFTMFDVEFTTGSITIHDAYPDTAMLYSTEGNYFFSFTPEHEVTTDMYIFIELPRELQVQ